MRIAAESRDIVLHPLEAGDLIEQAVVTGEWPPCSAEFGLGEKAEELTR